MPAEQTSEDRKYIKEAARKVPIDKCYANPDWPTSGMAQVVITRKKKSGRFVIGVYLLDTFCLGLKNTLYMANAQEFELDELLEGINNSGQFVEECDPAFAQNLVYGAIEYAEDLGFAPEKDFAVSEFILDPVDDIEFVEIEFGKNGKPCFLAGPYDNTATVVAKLTKAVGPDGFDFVLPY